MPTAAEIIKKMQADQQRSSEEYSIKRCEKGAQRYKKFNVLVPESGVVEEMERIISELSLKRGEIIMMPPNQTGEQSEDFYYRHPDSVCLEWDNPACGGERLRVEAMFDVDNETVSIHGDYEHSRNATPLPRKEWSTDRNRLNEELARAFLKPTHVRSRHIGPYEAPAPG